MSRFNPGVRNVMFFSQQKLGASQELPRTIQEGRMKPPSFGRGSSNMGELRGRRGSTLRAEGGFALINGKGLAAAMTLGAIMTLVEYQRVVSPFVQDNTGGDFVYEYLIPLLVGAGLGIALTPFTSPLFVSRQIKEEVTPKKEEAASGADRSIPTFQDPSLEFRVAHPISQPALPAAAPAPQKSGPENVTIADAPSARAKAEPEPQSSKVISLGSSDIVVENGPFTVERNIRLRQRIAEIERSVFSKVNQLFDGYIYTIIEKLRTQGDGNVHERIPGHEQYRILGRLARGGMGAIYLAYDDALGRYVTIKHPSGYLQRFETEMMALARLGDQNDNIMKIFGVIKNPVCFVAEFIEGVDLKALRKYAHLTPAEALVIIMHVLKTLAFAHEQEVIHRDIKPQNVMISRHGRLKVIDFGLAKGEEIKSGFTMDGAALGSPEYIDPALLQPGWGAQMADTRSDIYAVGILLYYLINGREPRKFEFIKVQESHFAEFGQRKKEIWAAIVKAEYNKIFNVNRNNFKLSVSLSEEELDRIFHILQETMMGDLFAAYESARDPSKSPVPEEGWEGIPIMIRGLIEKLTAKDPRQRFQSCSEALKETRDVLAKLLFGENNS